MRKNVITQPQPESAIDYRQRALNHVIANVVGSSELTFSGADTLISCTKEEKAEIAAKMAEITPDLDYAVEHIVFACLRHFGLLVKPGVNITIQG